MEIKCPHCGVELRWNPSPVSTGKCPNCGKEFSLSDPSCPKQETPPVPLCPEPETSSPAKCPSCGAPVEPGSRYCGQCGTAISAPKAVQGSRTPKKTYTRRQIFLLAIYVVICTFLGFSVWLFVRVQTFKSAVSDFVEFVDEKKEKKERACWASRLGICTATENWLSDAGDPPRPAKDILSDVLHRGDWVKVDWKHYLVGSDNYLKDEKYWSCPCGGSYNVEIIQSDPEDDYHGFGVVEAIDEEHRKTTILVRITCSFHPEPFGATPKEGRKSVFADKGQTAVSDTAVTAVSDTVVFDIISGMVKLPGKNILMGKTEVTQSHWEAVMGENPSHFEGANNPVERISWNDCQKFLETLNAQPAVKKSGLTFRLPTVEEWEFACHAGATGDYCKLANGTEITRDTLGQVAWFDANSGSETHSVGQKQPNAFGLYDMHGNVWEWTSTAVGEFRVYRGGCWYSSDWDCGSSLRLRDSPSIRLSSLGFRLCASGKAD